MPLTLTLTLALALILQMPRRPLRAHSSWALAWLAPIRSLDRVYLVVRYGKSLHSQKSWNLSWNVEKIPGCDRFTFYTV